MSNYDSRQSTQGSTFVNLVSIKNKLIKICDRFSRIDFFWKKECAGRTRLMRKGI